VKNLSLKDEIKSLIVKNGMSMSEVIKELNKKYSHDYSLQNFSNKLSRGSIKYKEVEEILDILGYNIAWNKRQE
jgi:hypothetical protein